MEVKKTINEYNSFDSDLISDNKILSIYQTGDDINLSCKFNDYSKISTIDFCISKDQEILYYIFNKLYENIVSGNILDENICSNKVQERINIQKNMSYYKSIVKNDVITILSDEYPIYCPNILKINKTKENIILSFNKEDGKVPKIPYLISINIRMSGSNNL